MFGNGGKKSVGKTLIRSKNISLLCDVDEYGNIIPHSCEPLLHEEHAEAETFTKPELKPLPVRKLQGGKI